MPGVGLRSQESKLTCFKKVDSVPIVIRWIDIPVDLPGQGQRAGGQGIAAQVQGQKGVQLGQHRRNPGELVVAQVQMGQAFRSVQVQGQDGQLVVAQIQAPQAKPR